MTEFKREAGHKQGTRTTAKQDQQNQKGQGEPGQKNEPPKTNYINMILGGPAGGDPNRATKLHLRELREVHEMEKIKEMSPPIIFGPGDEIGIQQPHNDALVITAMVANYDIARILVDTGSSADIIYCDCFRRMNLDLEVRPVDTRLVGFSGTSMQAI